MKSTATVYPSIGENTLNEPGTGDDNKRLRRLLHNRLIDMIDDEGIDAISCGDGIRSRLADIADTLGPNAGVKLTGGDLERLADEIEEELSGYGPLSGLMTDDAITDILINGPHEIWIDRSGALIRTSLAFDDDEHLRRFIDRVLGAQGKQLDARHPTVDARLADGSRLHAVIPPLSPKGPLVSIRRFHQDRVGPDNLIASGFLSRDMLRFLQLIAAAGINVVIAGNAGAGKTSLLNVIAGFIPDNERIVTVEETEELKLHHPHVVPLIAREANSDDKGAVNLRDLVRTALRMRADRIIVGEVRGREVLDMLQAMHVGHDGSLTTLHANSPKDAINRMETLALMGDSSLTQATVRHMITSAVHIIIQVMRFRDGSRRVTNISELHTDGDQHSVRELFHFQLSETAGQTDLTGEHVANGGDSVIARALSDKGFDTAEYRQLIGMPSHEHP